MSRSKLCSVFQRRSWTLLMTLITTGLEWAILYFTNCKVDLHTEGLPEYGVLSLQLNATMSRTGSNFLQRNTKLCILSYLKQRLLLNILHSQFANFFLIVSYLQHRFVSGTVSGPPPDTHLTICQICVVERQSNRTDLSFHAGSVLIVYLFCCLNQFS